MKQKGKGLIIMLLAVVAVAAFVLVNFALPAKAAGERLSLNIGNNTRVICGNVTNITATLTTSGGSPISGASVTFTITAEHHNDVARVIDPVILTATTASNGTATLPGYNYSLTGDFHIQATAPSYSVSSSNIAFFVDPVPWNNPPVIYQATDAVKPGESFSINGYGFYGNDANFDIKINPANGTSPATPPLNAVSLEVVQFDEEEGCFVVAKMPSGATPGVYDIWVRNNSGWSNTYKLNAARPLFMSEYEVFNGLDIQVVGRNFDKNEFCGTQETKIRLVNTSSGASFEVPIKELNPYCIKFTITNEPLGTYYIEISNDNGTNWTRLENGKGDTSNPQGNYRAAQTLSIIQRNGTLEQADPLGLGVAWAQNFNWTNVYDVTLHGVQKNSTLNQWSPIQTAIDTVEAMGGGIVYFPAGYYHSSELNIGEGVLLMGEGRDTTRLYFGGTNSQFIRSKLSPNPGQYWVNRHGIARMSLLLANEDIRPDIFLNFGGNEVIIFDVRIDYPMETDISGRGIGVLTSAGERILMNDCIMKGFSSANTFSNAVSYFTMKNNYFEFGNGNLSIMASYSFVENNTVIAKNDTSSYGVTHGIFTRDKAYVANNDVMAMGYKNYDQNDGEGIAGEGPGTGYFRGRVLEMYPDGKTIRVNSMSVSNDWVHYDFNVRGRIQNRLWWPVYDSGSTFGTLDLVIVAGRGMGQLRTITEIDNATKKITVDKPFDVAPDTTSIYSVVNTMDCYTVYNNRIDDCTKGILPFGYIYDCVVAENLTVDTRGIWLWGVAEERIVQFNYFVRIARNTVMGVSRRGGQTGIGLTSGRFSVGLVEGLSGFGGTVHYATQIIDNKIIGDGKATAGQNSNEAPPVNGIFAIAYPFSTQHDQSDMTGRDIVNVLIQNNYITNSYEGVTLSRSTYGSVVVNNDFDSSVRTPWLNTRWNLYPSGQDAGQARKVNSGGNFMSINGAFMRTKLTVEVSETAAAAGNRAAQITAKLTSGTINDYGSNPVSGKILYIYKDGEFTGTATTNSSGIVVYNCENAESDWNAFNLFTVFFNQDDPARLNQAYGYAVFLKDDCQPPVILTQPQNIYTSSGSTVPISINAVSPDGNILSYQWYSVDWDYAAGGTAIVGATSSTYSFPVTQDGTYYFYCIVTARKNPGDAVGMSQTKSEFCMVTTDPEPNFLPRGTIKINADGVGGVWTYNPNNPAPTPVLNWLCDSEFTSSGGFYSDFGTGWQVKSNWLLSNGYTLGDMAPADVYKVFRFSDTERKLFYTIDHLPESSYTVRLHLFINNTSSNYRGCFDVKINTLFKSKVDYANYPVSNAVIIDYDNITPINNTITIDFDASAYQTRALINAIELIPTTALTPNPTFEPTTSPTAAPTATPTASPTLEPTLTPTAKPTNGPVSTSPNVEFFSCNPWIGGAWNGVYGSDGYVLFGYDNTPSVGYTNIAQYAGDVWKKPNYVLTQNGIMYSAQGGAAVIYPGYQNENSTVLDPPEGSDLQKIWVMSGPSASLPNSPSKTYAFDLGDYKERLFTLYFKGIDEYNMLYKSITFRDSEGNVLFQGDLRHHVQIPPGNVWEEYLWNVYLSFKVSGSFSVTIDSDGGAPFRSAISGVFFDTIGGDDPVYITDLNDDTQVDASDLAILLDDYGKAKIEAVSPLSDIDSSEQIDSADLSLLLDAYGQIVIN